MAGAPLVTDNPVATATAARDLAVWDGHVAMIVGNGITAHKP